MLRRVLTAVLIPLFILQIFSGYKSYRTPIIGNASLNRRGLHVWRSELAHRMAAWRRRRLANLVSDRDRAFFAEHGYVERRNLLSQDDHSALLAELKRLEAPAREMVEGSAITRRIVVTKSVLKQVPTLAKVLDSPVWRGLTRYVGSFDNVPIISIQTIFSQALDAAKDPQTELHMDTFHPTMKAWYFLEDVDEDQGPFRFVPGSHRLTRRRKAWQRRRSIAASESSRHGGSFRVSAKQLRCLGLPDARVMAVPANTLIVADTYGLHARTPSRLPSTRVEIYASMRPNPFNPFTRLDTAWLPFVSTRKELIGWWLEDFGTWLRLVPRIWRDVGNVNPWRQKH